MASRGRLPGLPAELRGRRRRRDWRSARAHRAPRLSGTGRARRRRDLVVADLPVAGSGHRLRRQRPRRDRSTLRDRGGLRPPRRGGPPPRDPGDPGPGHEPHQRPAPVVPRLARLAPGSYADWYIWRDPAGFDRRGRPLPPNNWVSWFGGPAWTYEPRRGSSITTRSCPSSRSSTGGSRRSSGPSSTWSAAGPSGAWTATASTPSTCSSSTRPCGPIRAVGEHSAWSRQDHRFDIDQPDLPALMARFRQMVDAAPDRMSVGELFVGTTEGAAALTTARHIVFDWELLTRPWSADAYRARDPPARARLRSRPVADRGPVEPRSAASRLAPDRTRSARRPRSRTRWPRPPPCSCLTVRGTPFLYYGEELGLGDVPIPPEESIDAPASRVRARLRVVGPVGGPDADALASGARRGLHGGQALAAPRAGRRRPERRDPVGGPAIGARDLPPDPGCPPRARIPAGRCVLADPHRRRERPGLPAPRVRAARRSSSSRSAPAGASATVPRPAHGGHWRSVVGTHLDPPGIVAGRSVELRPFEGIIAVAERDVRPSVGVTARATLPASRR